MPCSGSAATTVASHSRTVASVRSRRWVCPWGCPAVVTPACCRTAPGRATGWCAGPLPLVGGVRSPVLGDVPLRVDVPDRDPRVVPGLVGQEPHRDVVARLQVGVVAEVEEVLALLLAHVVVVGLARRPHRSPPGVGADLVVVRGPDGVADV